MGKVFDKEKKIYFKFLNGLRESGVVNMFGAVSYLMAQFPILDKDEAQNILLDWMNTEIENR